MNQYLKLIKFENLFTRIFISYSSNDTDIVENLRSQFNNIGIKAWVYSRDSTLGEKIWPEIEEKITQSEIIIFVVSDNTPNAHGQQRELDLVLKKVEPITGTSKIIPLFINGTNPSNYPEVLRNKNGDFIDAHTVKSVVWKIAKHAFPYIVKKKAEESWNYPIPGQWLEVSNLDAILEKYFDIGDKLYFRAISPMGLLECYSPTIMGIFWIAPENVRPSLDVIIDKELEESVPPIFKVSGMIEIQMLGWKIWHERNKADE